MPVKSFMIYYLDHGLVASPDVYQGVRLEHIVDFIASAVFVQSAHTAIDFISAS